MSAEYLAGAVTMLVWCVLAALVGPPLGRWMKKLRREYAVGLRCEHGWRFYECPWARDDGGCR